MYEHCPVCGYAGDPAPFDAFDICPCCATQFEYSDCGRSHAELRERWKAGGCKWWSRVMSCPDGWDAQEQLRRAGLEGA